MNISKSKCTDKKFSQEADAATQGCMLRVLQLMKLLNMFFFFLFLSLFLSLSWGWENHFL